MKTVDPNATNNEAPKAKPVKLTPEQTRAIILALRAQAPGLAGRKIRKAGRRARGQEPEPGVRAGVKRHARFLARTSHGITEEPHVHPRHKRAA